MNTSQMKKKPSIIQIMRALIQLAAFVLVPGLFIKLFSAFGSVYTALLNGSFTFAEHGGSLLLIGLTLLFTLIWGRFFCSFLCSFGAMQDLLWALGKRVSPIRKVPEAVDEVMKLGKYFVLLFVVVGVWTFAVPGDSVWSPWTVFGAFTSFGTLPAKEIVLSVGGLLLLLTVAGSVLVERFFCKYLCPLGAVFALVSYFRLFKIKRNGEACGSCRLCTQKCSMGIPLYRTERVCSGECIDCMRCVSACPNKRIKADTIPAVSGTLAAAALAGMTMAGPIPTASRPETEIVASQSTEQETGIYTDGVYTGSGQGYKGTITAQVTVENGTITDVTVLTSRDDREFFDAAQSGVIAQILERQSAQVDTVTGATFSSRGLIEAVTAALASGALKETASATSEATTAVPETTTAAPETTSEPTTEESTTESTTTQAEPSTSPASGQYADGVYTGSGNGFRGTTSVRVTVENGAITDITVTGFQDDGQFFSRAQAGVIPAILSAQSVNVSAVSGATFSSNSILEAVADALGIDFTNPNENASRGRGRHG